MEKTLNLILQEIIGMKNQINGLEDRMTKLDEKVDRIEFRMENEVIDKLRILFDARQADSDRLDRIERKVDLIFDQVGVHEVQIKLLKK